MARKSKSKPSVDNAHVGRYAIENDAPWGGFINIKVEEAQTADFLNWWETNRQEAWRAIDDLMGEGMKISFSYDAENECYICSFTGKGWDTSLSRWCMTTRAGTFDEVAALAVWKHVVLADMQWGDYLPSGKKKMQWG